MESVVKSDEEYQEMWMALFDISVISSCNVKDPDLFCASALLKTAFYTFIKLKRRLIETEELVESQRLALEAYKRESTIMKPKSSSLTSAVCLRCGGAIEDCRWLPGERPSNLQHPIQSTDNADTKDSRIYSKYSQDEIHYSPKKKEKQDQQNSLEILVSELTDPEVKLAGPSNLVDECSGDVNKTFASSLVLKSKFSTRNCKQDADETNSETLVHCLTPKKRISPAKSQNVSPILKPFKKPRLSPAMSLEALKCGKTLLKSSRLFPSDITTPSRKDRTKNVSHIEQLTARRKISLHVVKKTQSNTTSQVLDKEGSPESHNSSDNEEVEIILPSPVLPKSMGYFSNKGISPLDGSDEDDLKNKKRKVRKSMNQGLSDTEVTFFLPMEECSGEEKTDSPSYRYQRTAVRKKKERRKLFGWECKDCEKYYEAAGLSAGEKRDHLNKCSRHRDKFSPQDNFPEGFWNPVFPETPQ
ncbi:hypothetical protein J437_LFUL014061 [Ladona fulva]|uniref:DNA endonuclease activator Ctp1 C-terminal domain-containing protein n=1 Tax=Ladona fulva TaxID=123851 RepID=A0A8K0KQZ5_LADFU|nr:hypothetical protein J437_LFUL014061 [Ladona fulva]